MHNSHKKGEQGISESLYFPQKLWTPLHVPTGPVLQADEGTYTFLNYPRILRIFLMWTCTRTSFTSRDLRGWFHTFTSLPLVHTQNLDFLRWRLWLGFLLIPEASFMKIFTHQDLWTWNSLIFPKFVTSCLHEFIRFLKFANFPLTDFARFHLP
jgi:hypothetical protein